MVKAIKKLTALRLEPKQIRALSKLAKQQDRAVSYLIRKAIDAFIKKER